jgi:Ni/Co efflux regulator RcnB
MFILKHLMSHSRSIFLAFFIANQALLPLQNLYAKQPDTSHARAEQGKNHPANVHQNNKQQSSKEQKRNEQKPDKSMSQMSAPSSADHVAVGGYFQIHQIEAVRNFYNRAENKGFCPPGLAKKGSGCLPPGQAKKWKKGESLPANLPYYELPRSVVLALGVPPPGYKYVRVASDILLIAIGTNMVMDAIEDLVQ